MNINQRSNGIWQAELQVPADVRKVIGKRSFRKSLGVRDKRHAQIEAAPLLNEWQRQIDLARLDPNALLEEFAVARARDLNNQARGEKPCPDTGATQASAYIDDYFDSIQDHVPPSELKRLMRIFSGKEGIPLPTWAEQWIAEYDRPRTRTEAKKAMSEAVEYFPTLDDLLVPNVYSWWDAMASEGLALKTAQKRNGFLSEYLKWLKQKSLIPYDTLNPFTHPDLKWPKKLKKKQGYIPLTNDEVVVLFDAARASGDKLLAMYIDIARHTGLRLAEIGSLSEASVVNAHGVDCFRVKPDAKTEKSSNRLVPIAPALSDRYDFSEFNLTGTDNAVGKRFGRLKKSLLENGESRRKCFHSIRKTFVSICEDAEILEAKVADVVGHEKQTLTYGVYSGGTAVVKMREVIDQVASVWEEMTPNAASSVVPFRAINDQ